MSNIDSVIRVTITRASSYPSLPGFGTPMIYAGVHTHFGARLKYYTSPAGMLTDGFTTSDQAYKDAVALMSQNPRPVRFAVGRGASRVQMVDTVTIAAGTDGTYTVTINGTDFDFVASSNTAAQIVTGLVTAINLGDEPVTAFDSTGDTLTLTADEAGIPFTATVDGPAAITIAHTTANVGVPEDIAAIQAEQADWYALLMSERDPDDILAAAATIEPMIKMFFPQSSDADIVDEAYVEGGEDIANRLFDLGYARTSLWYSPDDTVGLAAAVVGKMLPGTPGKATWFAKTLNGISTISFTETQYTNIKAKAGNSYHSIGGLSWTFDGKVSSDEYIDIIHGTDHCAQLMQIAALVRIGNSDKVPMTQRGIDAFGSDVAGALATKTRDGLIAESRVVNGKTVTPAYTVTTPNIADVSSTDRQHRTLMNNPIAFEGTYANAIHAVAFEGTLAV